MTRILALPVLACAACGDAVVYGAACQWCARAKETRATMRRRRAAEYWIDYAADRSERAAERGRPDAGG